MSIQKNSTLGITALMVFTAFGFAQTQPKASDEVTFARDVLPILQRSCQGCHRPGQIGPMSLLTYEEVRPWAKAIKSKVTLRSMPPWYIDRTVGIHDFKNDISLSDKEIALISKWVDAGSPAGNPANAPPARKFDDNDRWHIGTPDIVVTLPKDILVKARQADQWLDVYMQDLPVKTNRYIQALEIKPIRGTKVVHHVESSLIDPDDESQAARQHLEEYAVGKYGDVFPNDSGMLLKPGARVLANLHLHASGDDQLANIAIGLKLYPEGVTPKHIAHAQQLGSANDLDLRPGQKNIRSDGYTVLTKPAVITSFQPHMHNRGQAQCLELIYPTGVAGGDRPMGVRSETVSCVDRFKFDWHVVYEYADDVAPIVPAGTILHVISVHDNSPGNPSNPDPTNWVGYGNRTIDEMAFAWINWYNLTDDEYKEAVAARKAKTNKTSASLR